MRRLSIALSVTAAMLLAGGLTGYGGGHDLEGHARDSRHGLEFFAHGSRNRVRGLGPVLSTRLSLAVRSKALPAPADVS